MATKVEAKALQPANNANKSQTSSNSVQRVANPQAVNAQASNPLYKAYIMGRDWNPASPVVPVFNPQSPYKAAFDAGMAENQQRQSAALANERAQARRQAAASLAASAKAPDLGPDPSLGERVGKTVLGAAKGSAGDAVGAFANFYEGGIGGAAAQRERELAELKNQQRKAMEAYKASLDKYEGDANNVNVQAAQRVLDDINMQIGVYENIDDSSLYDFANDTYYAAANKIKESSQADIERAKQGLGAGGRFAIDLGVAATQMGIDALTMKGLGIGSAKNGVKAAGGLLKYLRGPANVLPAMAVHSYGAGAMQARDAGAAYERQAMYGLANAMKEVFTEKIGDMPKLAGGGLIDDAVNKALAKFVESPAAKTAIRTVVGFSDEAFEEFLGDAIDPALRSIYNNKGVLENYSEEKLSDWFYDALVGGVLGALGTGRAAVNGSFAAEDAGLKIQQEAQAAIQKELPTNKSSTTRKQASAISKVLSGEQLSPAEQRVLDRSPVSQSVLAEMQNRGVSTDNPLYNAKAKRTDEKLAQTAAKATDGDFASYSVSDLVKIARAAETAKDDALKERVNKEFERRLAEEQAQFANETPIDASADAEQLASRLNPQLREQGDRNEPQRPLESTEFDANGNPIPESYQPERAPIEEEAPPEQTYGELTDEQRELVAQEANQQPAQQPAPKPQQPTGPFRTKGQIFTVEDFRTYAQADSVEGYKEAFREAAQNNPELIDQLLNEPSSLFGDGRNKIDRALKALKEEYANQQNSGTIGASNTEEANNGGEQVVQQPAAGVGGDAGAAGGQALGRNADVSGGRSDSDVQRGQAGLGSRTDAGRKEDTGRGQSFLSVSKAKNGADLEGDVISERDYDKDQREFSRAAYEDGFESTTIIAGNSFVIDGIEATGHVDGNGNLTVANLDPEKRRCVKDHECIHLWSSAIPDSARLSTLRDIALSVADRDTLRSMYNAYSSNLKTVYPDLNGDAFKAKVVEEILGDMYGGINRFETNASYYRAAAQGAVKNAKMRQNYLDSTRNKAINKAWGGDTRRLKTRDIKSALAYTLDRLSPETKTKPTAERAADIMLAYYDEGSDGTLNGMSKEQTKHAIAVMRNLLNELGARKVSLSDFTGSTTDHENSFGLTQDRSSESFEGKKGTVFTRKQKNKFVDLSQEAKPDLSEEKEDIAKKVPLQGDEEYLKGNFSRDLEALKKTSEWEAGGRKGKMPIGANYLEGLPVSSEKNGWLEHKMPSQNDINEARALLEKKGQNAAIEEQYKLLDSHRQWLESVAAEMRAVRAGFYGSENVEQRKADLGYIADGVKEQISQLDADIGYLEEELDRALESNPESNEAISLVRDLEEADSLRGKLNSDLEALRDEYRHLNSADDAALTHIRSLIDSVSAEMDELGSKLSKSKDSSEYLFKKADEESRKAEQAREDGDEFWAESYRRSANEFRVAAEKQKRRENWAKRTLAQAEAFEERQPSGKKFFVEASESANEREPLPPGDQALLESHMRGGDYVPSTKEPKIRNRQTEEANRIIENAPGGVAPDVEQQRDISARNYEIAKADAELNEKIASQMREDLGLPQKPKAVRHVTDADLKGFDIAREIRQGYVDRYTNDSGKVPVAKSGLKDYAGFRTSKTEGSFSTADTTFSKEQSDFRKKLDNIVNAKGELFKAQTEADQAPLHDDSDNPKAKLTKEQREAQSQRVGQATRNKPVTQEVADAMLHLQEDVKGILESDAPLRHVLNLTESIGFYEDAEHEMNWLATKGIADTARELRDIFNDKNMDTDVKAQQMADATTRLLQQVATRVDRVEANRARGLKLESSIEANANIKESKTKLTKAGQKAANLLKSMQLNPTTAFKMADGFDKSGSGTGYWIARQIENSVAREQMLTADVHGRYAELRGIDGFDDFVNGKSLSPVEVPTVGQITEQQAIEFIKAVKTLKATKVGPYDTRLDTLKGFTFIDKNGKEVNATRKDLKVAAGDNFAHDMENLAIDMERKLSPAAKKYLEITNGILDDLGNSVSSAMQRTTGLGMQKYRKGEYYPVRYQAQGDKKATLNKKPSGMFDFASERTKTTGGMVRIESAVDTVDKYIERAVYASAYGDLADTLEFLNTPALGLQGLSNAATNSFGAEYGRMFNNYVNDVAQQSVKENGGVNDLMRTTRQLLQQGALRFSVSVPIKQVASYWNAMGVLSPEALAQAYRLKVTSDKGYGKDNLQLQYRKVGGIDPTLSEMLNNKGYLAELKKKSGIIDAWDKAISTMDYRTVDDLYHACIIDAKTSFPSIDQNSKQFADIVNALFQEAVLSTQPTFNANARSEYQRTNKEWIRMLGMFRTQQTQNFNRAITAIGEYRASKGTILEATAKKQLRQTIAGQMAAALEFAALSIVADLARHKLKPYKKDDEEGVGLDWEKVFKRLLLNTGEGLAGNVWFGNYAAQYIVDAITGDTSLTSGEFRGISLGALSSAYSALNSVSKAANSIAKAVVQKDVSNLDLNSIRYGITNTAQLFGVPANNIVNLASSLAMYILDGVSLATDGRRGNRTGDDDAVKMLGKMLKGTYTEEAAKRQANIAFRNGDAENVLYNVAILQAAGGEDKAKGSAWLSKKLKETSTGVVSSGELSNGERIANYLIRSGLSDEQIDSAVDAYAQTGGYNALYDVARKSGLSPSKAVSTLSAIDRSDKANGNISDADLKAYWHKHPGENKLVEALYSNKDNWSSFYAPYNTVISAGASPKKAEQLVESIKGEDGRISQKEFLAYYQAHPEDEEYIITLWDTMGYTNKGKPRTWESYKTKNKVK